MLQFIKKCLKRVLPPPTKTFLREINQLNHKINQLNHEINQLNRTSSEAIWAQTFSYTIKDSTWLRNPTFSPGRWAVGYPFLYVMYRILNETKPKCILEFGLGQSTKMIAQYAAAHPDVKHIVIEQNSEWIDVFKKNYTCPDSTQIIYVPLIKEMFGDTSVHTYDNLSELLSGYKFDFISVDGPSDPEQNSKYRRIDLLPLIPDCLANSFSIILDDAERKTDLRSYKLIEKKLSEMKIEFCDGVYSGEKDVMVLCSLDNEYLCTM